MKKVTYVVLIGSQTTPFESKEEAVELAKAKEGVILQKTGDEEIKVIRRKEWDV